LGKGEVVMFEPLLAFLIIIAIAVLIYLLTGCLSPKTSISKEKNLMYACGEKINPTKLLVNVTLFRYLIYFVIIDSPALILAFAAISLEMISPIHLLIYLALVLVADFLLLGGHE